MDADARGIDEPKCMPRSDAEGRGVTRSVWGYRTVTPILDVVVINCSVTARLLIRSEFTRKDSRVSPVTQSAI